MRSIKTIVLVSGIILGSVSTFASEGSPKELEESVERLFQSLKSHNIIIYEEKEEKEKKEKKEKKEDLEDTLLLEHIRESAISQLDAQLLKDEELEKSYGEQIQLMQKREIIDPEIRDNKSCVEINEDKFQRLFPYTNTRVKASEGDLKVLDVANKIFEKRLKELFLNRFSGSNEEEVWIALDLKSKNAKGNRVFTVLAKSIKLVDEDDDYVMIKDIKNNPTKEYNSNLGLKSGQISFELAVKKGEVKIELIFTSSWRVFTKTGNDKIFGAGNKDNMFNGDMDKTIRSIFYKLLQPKKPD